MSSHHYIANIVLEAGIKACLMASEMQHQAFILFAELEICADQGVFVF